MTETGLHRSDLPQRLDALEQKLAAMNRGLNMCFANLDKRLSDGLRAVGTGPVHVLPSTLQADYLSEHAGLQLFGTARVLDSLDFQPPVYLYDAAVSDVQLGAWTYLSSGVHAACADIGSYCAIGERTIIAGSRPHRRNALCSSALVHETLLLTDGGLMAMADDLPPPTVRISLGHDVSIGHSCCICPEYELEIGAGTIIENNTVIRGITQIEPYSIVAGNPGRIIGRRFDERTADALLASRWWEYDWPAIIGMAQHAGRFDLNDAAAFLECFCDYDKEQLPRLSSRKHRVTAAGSIISLDGLRICP